MSAERCNFNDFDDVLKDSKKDWKGGLKGIEKLQYLSA